MRARHQTYQTNARGHAMDQKSAPTSRSRRDFLATTSLLAAAAAAPKTASALAAIRAPQSGEKPASPGTLRKIPIGVFDPAFPNLSTDEMIDKFAAWGVEAVEIGTGGYPNSTHCPVKDLLDDPAKRRRGRRSLRTATSRWRRSVATATRCLPIRRLPSAMRRSSAAPCCWRSVSG